MNEVPKLPQARMYLRAAQWGFDELLAKRLTDTAFGFYLIGILASLRAVQHALKAADSTLGRPQAGYRGMVAGYAAKHPRTAFHSNYTQSYFEGWWIPRLCYLHGIFDRRGTKHRDNRDQLRAGILRQGRQASGFGRSHP
jgi:hypothetical protein